ncbi:hypothetical protein [Shewanella aestuarii]|uniref:Uncharacterized protein n=1 Tax=Shewanella aestuarii TaxID=1028752 RepID=A0A6G9QRC8_9GAMM|nr:hypothetical protein [Shewanella aestuarii]QIR16653.1 hypothetical protein HBH39_19460 [Shewanella aestuarii]
MNDIVMLKNYLDSNDLVENRTAFFQVIDVLLDGTDDDQEKVDKLNVIASEHGINTEKDSIDDVLGLTILYGDGLGGLDGLVSGEEDYLEDLYDMVDETELDRDYLNDKVFFGDCSEVININSGFYAGGVTRSNLALNFDRERQAPSFR